MRKARHDSNVAKATVPEYAVVHRQDTARGSFRLDEHGRIAGLRDEEHAFIVQVRALEVDYRRTADQAVIKGPGSDSNPLLGEVEEMNIKTPEIRFPEICRYRQCLDRAVSERRYFWFPHQFDDARAGDAVHPKIDGPAAGKEPELLPFANPARRHEVSEGGRDIPPYRSRSFTDIHRDPATDGLVPMRTSKSTGQLVEVLQDGTT